MHASSTVLIFYVQSLIYFAVLLALALPIGHWVARVALGEAHFSQNIFGRIERLIYRLTQTDPTEEMSWKRYALAACSFNALGFIFLYALQRLQHRLPLNPDRLAPVKPQVALNTAISFVTNTNWQAYGGESTMSYLTQMLGLGVQNFLSASTGLAVLFALTRGFSRKTSDTIGNFVVDIVRSTLYILLPLSLIFALLLVSQGVIQTFDGAVTTERSQTMALGPVASQVAIKQLGTNGGGFFNTNSAHPFENPTPLSNFIEMIAILLLPTALCFSFGTMVRDKRQGYALCGAMFAILLPMVMCCYALESQTHPWLTTVHAMEGKEVRFGIGASSFWAVLTTAASNGSVNAMHDSFMPLAGLIPMWLMQLGEIVFGGVGSGLYGMIIFAIVSVFIVGLMVGRTPEYLGKKIEAFEIKMASLIVILPAITVLIGTAVACVMPDTHRMTLNHGPHGFSEILYAFSSASNNNGSAFAGLAADGWFYSVALGLAMLIGRFGVILPVLALAGSLANKKATPITAGTMPTYSPLFVFVLVCTILLVGALTFVPALALGPIVDHLQLFAKVAP